MAGRVGARKGALALKGRSPQAAERLAQTPRSKVAISVITEMELRFGLAKHPTPHRLKPVIDTLLQTIKVLPLPDDIAVTYGALRAELERSGRPIGPLDTSSPRMQLRWGPCSSPTT